MKQIPFYANPPHSAAAATAVYQVLFDYFLNRKLSGEDITAWAGSADGRAPGIIKPFTLLARQGFDIQVISPFDYVQYAERGQAYLDEVLPSTNQAVFSEDNTALVPEFLRTIKPERRQPGLQDVDDLLAEDRLVMATVNGAGLWGAAGQHDQVVLIIQRQGEEYILHDPGQPPQAYRRLSRHQLGEALNGAQSTSQITGIIFRKAHDRRRLDQYVLAHKPRLSRAFAAKLIEQGRVLVNGTVSKPGYRVRDQDVITIDYADAELDTIPAIDLPILYEDSDVVVINKPAGVLTHSQGAVQPEATVATFLRDRISGLEGERAGIVHRLDRATSGVLIGAKHPAALQALQKQFADRTAKKTYVAIVQGHLKQPEAVINMPIERSPKAPATFRVGANGKPAVTQYKVMAENATASLVELQPQTGRTHQLRVHLAQLGHPIVGDPLYGNGHYGDRLYLHAKQLSLTLPNGEHKTFTAPLPPEFEEYMAQ